MGRQLALELSEDVSFEAAGFSVAGVGDGAALSRETLVGLDADEGIAADAFAAFNGLQKEGFGLFLGLCGGVSGQTQKCADRGFKVGDQSAMDRDECVLPGEAAEVCFGRKGRSRHGLLQFTVRP